jgi:hypothetical protein
MAAAHFRAIGGAILADHGPMRLAQARAMAVFYACEAARLGESSRAAGLCAERCRALSGAADDAARWRRAAGWADPEMAD